MTCAACGYSIPVRAKFCSECGAPIAVAPPTQAVPPPLREPRTYTSRQLHCGSPSSKVFVDARGPNRQLGLKEFVLDSSIALAS